MHLNFLNLIFCLAVIVIMIAASSVTTRVGSEASGSQHESFREDNCIYNEKEAEESPWTITLRVYMGNEEPEYYVCVILDPYTVMTYSRPSPFHFNTDKLGFLPWSNYSILTSVSENGLNASTPIEVSFMQPHPKFEGRTYIDKWMLTEYDNIIIHLKSPIPMSSTVRPVCLPTLNNDMAEDLNKLFAENTTTVIGGWNRGRDLEKTSVTVKLSSAMECQKIWKSDTEDEGYNNLSYKNRACGYVLQRNSNNQGGVCIRKDSGALVNHSGRYIFMGFVNTFGSKYGGCGPGAFFYMFRLSHDTLKWLNATLRCGSFKYTCHNGECVDIQTVCNQMNDSCSDASDEDHKYCRALNPCKKDQFECGVYDKCIPRFSNGKEAHTCDGVSDCPFNEDEEFCEANSMGSSPLTSSIVYDISGVVVCTIVVFASILTWIIVRRRTPRWTLPEETILHFEIGSVLDGASEIETICNQPFDRDTYEISLDLIEKGVKIGQGVSGDVYLGAVGMKPKGGKTQCAIKIPKPNAQPEEVEGFLKEIKLMAYVGKHENIAEFYRAYTRRLREGILYIIVEYCEFGSMKDFLTKYKESFIDEMTTPASSETQNGTKHYVSVDVQMFTTTDLIRWGSQVATGMLHLSNKQVIHGDLAARNILLDRNRTAKICDFGLSHHLYTNATYIASSQSRLPWKWTAIETLLDRTMSTKSDVWSFGVTLWEMFTLGDEPYGDLEWSPSFPYSLSTTGCPLEQPSHANSKIFQIMRDAWTLEPNDRPTFECLEHQLRNGMSEINEFGSYVSYL